MDSFKKNRLDKIKYSVRGSQAVLQYGVGAMVDFEDQVLMTADSQYWAPENRFYFHDERLERLLSVDGFVSPCLKEESRDPGDGIAYVRFPEWYFCPKCRKFQRITDWIEYNTKRHKKKYETDPYMIKTMKCGDCMLDLVVTRIVTVCENGHIDDFPWVEWVHAQNIGGPREICSNPQLDYRIVNTTSTGLDSISVKCKTCNCRATLKSAFVSSSSDFNIFQYIDEKNNFRYGFKCKGKHPWKHAKEDCNCYPRTMQRGSSSVYFPVTASSLVIPPFSSYIRKTIMDSSAYKNAQNEINKIISYELPEEMTKELIKKQIPNWTDDIFKEVGIDKDKISSFIKEKSESVTSDGESGSTFDVNYRYEEYLALTGVEKSNDLRDEFQCEYMNIDDYHGVPYISKVTLVHKVREVQAHVGFSRIEPTDPMEAAALQPKVVSVMAESHSDGTWYPAYQVRGEGIFVEFDSDSIKRWLTGNKTVKERTRKINERFKSSYLGKESSRYISSKYILLHTLAHLLIKQLSFECGYNIASLRERIYSSDSKDGKIMSGIFIYTSSGDSEGTLGGLVRQGRSDVFPGIIEKAIQSSLYCSNDPVCSLSQGQGLESLNMSSCYACSLIPETSCEDYNVFLDRSMVTGIIDKRKIGFYSLFSDAMQVDIDSITGSLMPGIKQTGYVYNPNDETLSVPDAIDALKEDDVDEVLSSVFEDICRYSENHNYERPRMDASIPIETGKVWPSLVWGQSKVAWFLPYESDEYSKLLPYDWRCYLISEKSSPHELFKYIREN